MLPPDDNEIVPTRSATGAVLVIGASGGIGAALSRRLAERDVPLVVAARRQAPLKSLAREVGALAVPTDASDFKQVDACFELAVSKGIQITGVVNCAGSILIKPAHMTTEREWAAALANNLTSAFAVLRSGAAHMPGRGSIVLIASAAARAGLPNHEAIAAAKGGVIGLARAAAATYARRGLRVNVVAPGLVNTPLSERITSNERLLEKSRRMHPLGRIGEPDDVASAVEWLLGATSDWVTGQVLGVDGGLATLRSTQ